MTLQEEVVAPPQRELLKRQPDEPGATSESPESKRGRDDGADRENTPRIPLQALQLGRTHVRAMDPAPGLVGLANLGNTCFMNSALQCLSNTAPLTEYLLSGRWAREVNEDNPLGMQGRMAAAFAGLVGQLWAAPPRTVPGPVSAGALKRVVSARNSLFEGYHQQDSQELLGTVLDGLHEDLNRIQRKPYVEAPEMAGRPDAEVAEAYWAQHKARNDSAIVDLFQGQFKSVVSCLRCGLESATFDPFMFVSTPVPDRRVARVRVCTTASADSGRLVAWVATLPRNARVSALKSAAGAHFGWPACSEVVAVDVFQGRVFRVYDDSDAVASIGVRDTTLLVVSPSGAGGSLGGSQESSLGGSLGGSLEDSSNVPAVMADPPVDPTLAPNDTPPVKTHQEKAPVYTAIASPTESMFQPLGVELELVGVPLAIPLPKTLQLTVPQWIDQLARKGDETALAWIAAEKYRQGGEPLRNLCLEALASAYALDVSEIRAEARVALRVPRSEADNADERAFAQWLAHGWNSGYAQVALEPTPDADALLEQLAAAQGDQPRDTTPVTAVEALPPRALLVITVPPDGVVAAAARAGSLIPLDEELPTNPNEGETERVTLQDCIRAFTREEELRESDAWYCPRCRQHQPARKKMDIWKVPDVLVFHLKRFANHHSGGGLAFASARAMFADKIDTLVDAPATDLDLAPFVQDPAQRAQPLRYNLYAVSNHYGGLGGGHYTAHAQSPVTGRWHTFDDARVHDVSGSDVVSGAAYLLFYVRQDKHWLSTFPDALQGIYDSPAVPAVPPSPSLSSLATASTPSAGLSASRFESGPLTPGTPATPPSPADSGTPPPYA